MHFESTSLTQILRQKPQNTGHTYIPNHPIPYNQKPEPKRKVSSKNEYRAGDWICTVCNNHNYSFRSLCNRCNTQTKESNLKELLLSCNNENSNPNIGYQITRAQKTVEPVNRHLNKNNQEWNTRLPFRELGIISKQNAEHNGDGLFSCFDKLIVNSDTEENGCDFNLNSSFFDFMNYE